MGLILALGPARPGQPKPTRSGRALPSGKNAKAGEPGRCPGWAAAGESGDCAPAEEGLCGAGHRGEDAPRSGLGSCVMAGCPDEEEWQTVQRTEAERPRENRKGGRQTQNRASGEATEQAELLPEERAAKRYRCCNRWEPHSGQPLSQPALGQPTGFLPCLHTRSAASSLPHPSHHPLLPTPMSFLSFPPRVPSASTPLTCSSASASSGSPSRTPSGPSQAHVALLLGREWTRGRGRMQTRN